MLPSYHVSVIDVGTSFHSRIDFKPMWKLIFVVVLLLISTPVTLQISAPGDLATIHEFGGHICLAENPIPPNLRAHHSFLRIWMLMDYTNREWRLEHNIDMFHWVDPRYFYLVIHIKVG